MEKKFVVGMFDALASEVRLDVFKLLVRYGKDGLVAGDIAAALNIPATNLSFHLKALAQAALVSATQEGRYQRYRANLEAMMGLIGYLTEECCAQQSEDAAGCMPKGAC